MRESYNTTRRRHFWWIVGGSTHVQTTFACYIGVLVVLQEYCVSILGTFRKKCVSRLADEWHGCLLR